MVSYREKEKTVKKVKRGVSGYDADLDILQL